MALLELSGTPERPQRSIHIASEPDREFIMELVREKYPTKAVDRSVPWVEWCLKNPDHLVLVGENSFGIARSEWVYGFERLGTLLILCSRGRNLEALRMVRKMIAWAKTRGCLEFRLDANTGVDFAAFGKRLKAKRETILRYNIPLGD